MSKKNKNRPGDHKKPNQGQPGRGLPGGMRDLTGERHFNTQMAKASRLIEEEDNEAALVVLAPLAQKYPDRIEVLDLLGVLYVNQELFELARDTFEKAVSIGRKKNQVDSVMLFNLAHMYLLTGFPLLAFQCCTRIDWAELENELEDETKDIREFRQLAEEAVKEMAASNNLPQVDFLKYALPIENGQLALQRNDARTAQTNFEEAVRLNPQLPPAYISLAMAFMQQNQAEKAIEQVQYVLNKLEPKNLAALLALARIYLSQDNQAEARQVVDRLKDLPPSAVPEEIVQRAEIYALLEDDQAVYDMVWPLFQAETDWEEVDPEAQEGAMLLALVAALHLGKAEEASRLTEDIEEVEDNILLERTILAIENGEDGPRAQGRFFYSETTVLYPEATRRYEAFVKDSLTKTKPADYRNSMNPFFLEFKQAALEITTFQCWLSNEQPVVMAMLLTQAIASGVEGASELARRFAFSRTGTDAQHLVAAAVLAEEGLVSETEPLTIWIDGDPRTASLDELTQLVGGLE